MLKKIFLIIFMVLIFIVLALSVSAARNPFLPDLYISSWHYPQQVTVGDPMIVEVETANNGLVFAFGAEVNVAIYSGNSWNDPNKIVVYSDTFDLGWINPLGSETITITLDTSQATPGDYYLVFNPDPQDLISESDENNNLRDKLSIKFVSAQIISLPVQQPAQAPVNQTNVTQPAQPTINQTPQQPANQTNATQPTAPVNQTIQKPKQPIVNQTNVTQPTAPVNQTIQKPKQPIVNQTNVTQPIPVNQTPVQQPVQPPANQTPTQPTNRTQPQIPSNQTPAPQPMNQTGNISLPVIPITPPTSIGSPSSGGGGGGGGSPKTKESKKAEVTKTSAIKTMNVSKKTTEKVHPQKPETQAPIPTEFTEINETKNQTLIYDSPLKRFMMKLTKLKQKIEEKILLVLALNNNR